jgi:hypothetical protein
MEPSFPKPVAQPRVTRGAADGCYGHRLERPLGSTLKGIRRLLVHRHTVLDARYRKNRVAFGQHSLHHFDLVTTSARHGQQHDRSDPRGPTSASSDSVHGCLRM